MMIRIEFHWSGGVDGAATFKMVTSHGISSAKASAGRRNSRWRHLIEHRLPALCSLLAMFVFLLSRLLQYCMSQYVRAQKMVSVYVVQVDTFCLILLRLNIVTEGASPIFRFLNCLRSALPAEAPSCSAFVRQVCLSKSVPTHRILATYPRSCLRQVGSS